MCRLLGLENRVMYTAMEVLDGECRLEQALIRDKRWRNLALLAISKNRQRYNITAGNMETLAALLIEKGCGTSARSSPLSLSSC